MNRKGNVTKQAIKESAHLLFSEKGFKDVTMKDICDKTDLSRGGLYRHYDGTIQIFEEILHDITNQDYDDMYKLMKDGVPAREIIEREFNKLQSEMFDDSKSLNYAIYEYSNCCNNNYILELNKKSEQKWTEFINYGIERKEFKSVEKEPLITLILYLYQGIRMWNRIVPIKKENVKKIFRGIQEGIYENNIGKTNNWIKTKGIRL